MSRRGREAGRWMKGGGMSRRLGPAAVVCVVLCAAGCASDESREAPVEERSPEGASGGRTAGSRPVGPPEDSASGTWESDVELENDREQFIAECMADQGFEYVPKVYAPETDGSADIDLYLEIQNDPEATIEYAREYGFGTFLGADEAMQLELAGGDDDSPPDPNDAIFEALSQSEREAYSRADFGCWDMMTERFPIAVSNYDDDTYEALDAIQEEFNERLAADPRIAEAQEDLMGCLGEAGLPEGTRWVAEYMEERFEQATGLDYEEAYVADFSEVDEDVLRELRAEERRVAEADARCQSDYYTIQNEVGSELEREVIESHPEILDMLADSP